MSRLRDCAVKENKASEILRNPKLVETLRFYKARWEVWCSRCGNVVFGERVFRAAAVRAPRSDGSSASGAWHHVLNASIKRWNSLRNC